MVDCRTGESRTDNGGLSHRKVTHRHCNTATHRQWRTVTQESHAQTMADCYTGKSRTDTATLPRTDNGRQSDRRVTHRQWRIVTQESHAQTLQHCHTQTMADSQTGKSRTDTATLPRTHCHTVTHRHCHTATLSRTNTAGLSHRASHLTQVGRVPQLLAQFLHKCRCVGLLWIDHKHVVLGDDATRVAGMCIGSR